MGRLTGLILVCAIAIFSFARPVYASPSFEDISQGVGSAIQQSSKFLEKCFLTHPDNGLEEVSCNITKTAIEAGAVVTICYTVDGLASSIFPPAAILAPGCIYLGIGGKAGENLAKAILH